MTSDKQIKFLKTFAKFFWIARFWYKMTMAFTRHKIYRVPTTFTDIKQVYDFMGNGNLYVPDKNRGRRDVMFHPTHSVKRIVNNDAKMSMDCEDHSSLVVTAILKNKLMKSCSLNFVYMKNITTGEVSGHSVETMTDFEGRTYWADYDYPVEYVGDWTWADLVGKKYNAYVFAADMIEVKRVRNDKPILGKYEHKIF